MNPIFQQVALQVMSDPNFARQLLDNPADTLRGAGIEPAPEILTLLASVDKQAMLSMADAFTDEHKAM